MKKVTLFIDDAVKAEIKRQATAESRSFAAFLRLFLKNQFGGSSPSLPVPTTAGPIVVAPQPMEITGAATPPA